MNSFTSTSISEKSGLGVTLFPESDMYIASETMDHFPLRASNVAIAAKSRFRKMSEKLASTCAVCPTTPTRPSSAAKKAYGATENSHFAPACGAGASFEGILASGVSDVGGSVSFVADDLAASVDFFDESYDWASTPAEITSSRA